MERDQAGSEASHRGPAWDLAGGGDGAWFSYAKSSGAPAAVRKMDGAPAEVVHWYPAWMR